MMEHGRLPFALLRPAPSVKRRERAATGACFGGAT